MRKARKGVEMSNIRIPRGFPCFPHFPLPIRRNEMRRRKLPPWSRHHEPWCGVFRDMPCDCDDDDRRPRYRRRPLAGGGAPAPERKKELEDA